MSPATETLDQDRVKAFTQLMVSHLSGAAVTLMLEVGRQTGLFDTMAAMPPATSAEIAARAGLTERYVREWLGAMTCGGLVEYEAAGGRYRLPPEHALLLTGQSSRNLTTMAPFFPLLGRVLPDVVRSFREGGGVPYSAYQPDFTGLMDRRSRPRYQELLLTRYLGSPEGLLARLESGIRVADVGCGTGFCVCLMATHFPRSRFVGYDFSETAIAEARAEAARMGLANASFEVQDVAQLPVSPPFDLITAFDAIHDQVDPAGVLRRIRGALAPHGIFLMLDVHASSRLEANVGVPMATFVYTVSTMHCMTVSLAHGGAGLGTAWGLERATEMLREAGFGEIQLFERVDPMNTLYAAR